MGAPGYDVERLDHDAMDAGRAALVAAFADPYNATHGWVRQRARAMATSMLTGMAAAGWTFIPPGEGHETRPAYDPEPPALPVTPSQQEVPRG